MTTTIANIHPFEAAGLGKAPFRYVGHERQVGPIITESGMEIGYAGQPMGTCDFCGQGIADCFSIQSADGNRFKVGCDCVAKIDGAENRDSGGAVEAILREAKKIRNERAKVARHAREQKQLTEAAEWLAANADKLQSTADPKRAGSTLAAKWDWFSRNAGTTGKLDCYKLCRKLIEAR
jgi:hypothetical protein